MIVDCNKCGMTYDDAQRVTLCPHPELHSWDWRGEVERYQKNLEQDVACKVLKAEPILSHDQIDRLCTFLGMPGTPVKRILIDINADCEVTFYTEGYVPVGAFDELLTMLASLKEQPDGQSSKT